MRIGRFRRTLALIAGARIDLLEQVPGAASKQVALGGILLTTAGIAGVSATFAVSMSLGLPIWVSAIIGVLWAGVIISLDRTLIIGMSQAKKGFWHGVGMVVPRLLLAAVLGTVISTPLTLQIFHREIDAELATMHAAASDEFNRSLAENARFAQIPDLTKKVADEQSVIASGGSVDSTKNPQVVAAQAEVDRLQAIYDKSEAEYQRLSAAAQCELDGTCGTGARGAGDAYQSAKARADAQLAVVNGAKADLDTANTALATARTSADDAGTAESGRNVAAATAALAVDKPALENLVALKTATQKAFDAQNANDTGILARLEALDELSGSRSMLQFAHFMLWALFFCIELLPIVIKLMSNAGKQSAYERAVQADDTSAAEAYLARQRALKHVEKQRTEAFLKAKAEELDIELQTSRLITEEVRRHQTDVVRAALEVWADHARTAGSAVVRDYESSLGRPAASSRDAVRFGGHTVPTPPAVRDQHKASGRVDGPARPVPSYDEPTTKPRATAWTPGTDHAGGVVA